MSGAVTVRKAESKADYKAFFNFPWTLYKDDPNWVPPLLSMRKDLLDQKHNPSWEYMEGDYFAAWRGDKIVGTIVAYINHRHNEFQKEHVGWFGMFEVYDDQEVANALLDTAVEWVKSRGYDGIRGPQSFTTHEECGVLINNFSRPVILMPYNPPYYQKLVENYGFVKSMDVHSIYYDRETALHSGEVERMKKLVEHMKRRRSIVVRPIDRKHLKQEFGLFKELYNAAWDKNWGFTPMTDKELDALVAGLGQFFDPDFAFFAEVDGKPAGFMLCVPDLNAVLHAAYPHPGEPELVTLVKALWYWKLHPIIDAIRTPLMGIKEEYRNMGLDVALYYNMIQAILPHDRYKYVDSGWILETNQLIKIVESLGGKVYKTHRFYEKFFDGKQ